MPVLPPFRADTGGAVVVATVGGMMCVCCAEKVNTKGFTVSSQDTKDDPDGTGTWGHIGGSRPVAAQQHAYRTRPRRPLPPHTTIYLRFVCHIAMHHRHCSVLIGKRRYAKQGANLGVMGCEGWVA